MSHERAPYREALQAVLSLLDALPGPAMVIGGLAVIAQAARPLDLEDARQLAMRHRRTLDRQRIRRTLASFDEVLDDGRSRVALWRDTERAAFPRSLKRPTG